MLANAAFLATINRVTGDVEPDFSPQAWREAHSGRGGARGRAMLFISQNRPDRAAEALRDCLAQDPNDAWAHAMLAGCLIDLDQPKQAIAHVKEALKVTPNEAYIHSTLAAAEAARGRLGKAHDAAQRARTLDPNDAGVAAQLASIFNVQNLPKQGLAEAQRGLSLDPQHVGCRASLADSLFALGKANEARQIIREILALDPEHRGAHRFQGMDALSTRDAPTAEQHFSQAMRVDPELAAKDSELRDGYRRSLMLSFGPYRWLNRATLPDARIPRMIVLGAVAAGIALLVSAGILVKQGWIVGLVLAGGIGLFLSVPLIAEAWIARYRPEARVLGPEARGRANVILAGALTVVVGIIALLVMGPVMPAFLITGVVAFAMPLSMAWTLRHARPTAAKVLPALLLIIGITAVVLHLTARTGGMVQEENLPQMLVVLYFVGCCQSYWLPRVRG